MPSDLCTAQLLFQLLCWTVTKTMSVALLLTNNLDNSKQKMSNLVSPTHNLFWANLRVQLHLPPLRSLDLLISPGTQLHLPPLRSLDLAWNPALGRISAASGVRTHTPSIAFRHLPPRCRKPVLGVLAHLPFCIPLPSDLPSLPTPLSAPTSHSVPLPSDLQGSRRDQEILGEGGGAGPSLLPRRDHE